jgi:hypothetical protein
MEKSRLAKHTYEEGHRIQWKEAKAVQIETNNICRKYKETAHMACITNPISQLSLEISPIWIPLIQEEGCRAVHCKNPGLLGKVLCRGLVPTLSNCHHTSLFHCCHCCFIFLFVFYIVTADFSFHFYLHFMSLISTTDDLGESYKRFRCLSKYIHELSPADDGCWLPFIALDSSVLKLSRSEANSTRGPNS